MYPGASDDPLKKPSPMIFLVDGVAHNHMNFGNFLTGAAGGAMGFTFFEMSIGAHKNSLENPQTNGYDSQLDSRDDQYSIRQGVYHALNHRYVNKEWRVKVGPLEKVSNSP